ncbi:MAG: PelD GGDEF domain-containing protein [Nitrospirota bacterium]|nr:PelD GGDEF domain-containing protein [Nitrospirota bacterium]
MRLPLHLRTLPPGKWQWVEVCGFSLLMLVLGHWIEPNDPYLTKSVFPWIWVAPLLVALRYGIWAGLVSSGIFIGGLYAESQFGSLGEKAFSKVYVIEAMLGIVICGEFGSRWNLQLKGMEERLAYLARRFQETTHAYHLLGMSHHHLEKSLSSRPLTLRVALNRLRGMLTETSEEIPLQAAGHFLTLLTQYFEFEVAAFLPAGVGTISNPPLASVGNPGELLEEDPLVRHAMFSGEFSHVMMNDGEPMTGTKYLIVAPARASDGKVVGWLAVERMRFLNLHEESLYMLNVFLSYFADGTQAAFLAQSVLSQFPDCPLLFAQELPRMVRLQNAFDMQSRIVMFTFSDGPTQDDFVQYFLGKTRGLDLVWDVHRSAGRALCVLLPFSDDEAVEGYLARMQELLKERFGMGYQEAGMGVTIRSMAVVDAQSLMSDLLSWSHHDHESIPVLNRIG